MCGMLRCPKERNWSGNERIGVKVLESKRRGWRLVVVGRTVSRIVERKGVGANCLQRARPEDNWVDGARRQICLRHCMHNILYNQYPPHQTVWNAVPECVGVLCRITSFLSTSSRKHSPESVPPSDPQHASWRSQPLG